MVLQSLGIAFSSALGMSLGCVVRPEPGEALGEALKVSLGDELGPARAEAVHFADPVLNSKTYRLSYLFRIGAPHYPRNRETAILNAGPITAVLVVSYCSHRRSSLHEAFN